MTEPKNDAHAHDASTSERLRDGLDDAKTRAGAAIDTAREKVSDAASASREKAREAAHRTAEAAEGNPLGLVAGGIALGALVAAVLPRSQREKELLAPIGKRVNASATAALAAARTAGKEELGQLGLTKGAAKDQAKSLLQGVAKAAASAGKAAAQAGREEARNA